MQHFAAAIGAVTLLVAGLIALVQTDIKRVIAYSTMSQIGYMFLAAGIGAYGDAMFHLMTHAFFKALLFLAAGIVIHALAGEQDIRKMGGLRDALPRTYLYMLIGSLALAGIFPFAGFWSKDSILASALASGPYGFVLFVAGLIGAFLTGLYTFRMIFLVWRGDRSPYVREHLHDASHGEAPASMLATVAVLAVLSVIGGWVQIPGLWDPLADWLAPLAEPLVEPSVLQDCGRLVDRDRARARRHLPRLALLRRAEPRCAELPDGEARARAQALLRRALRRRLLPAGRDHRERAAPRRRGAARRGLDRRGRGVRS